MGKISLIIQREYLTRVKKRSFIVISLLGPLLMVGLVFVQFWVRLIPEDPLKVQVIDESGLITSHIPSYKNLSFYYDSIPLKTAQHNLFSESYDLIVFVPSNILQSNTLQLFYKEQISLNARLYIESQVKSRLEDLKLMASGIRKEQLGQLKPDITVTESKLEPNGEIEHQNSTLSMVLGFISGLLIYMFVFLYGMQVMRGVIEEKTNRIVEVIISSVKPFQLMMGKIIGIAAVGLTQFLIWILLSTAGIQMLSSVLSEKALNNLSSHHTEQTVKTSVPIKQDFRNMDSDSKLKLLETFTGNINFPVMISVFILYFLLGYLLYSALFAAVGSAVDAESDTQQFMLPVTIPLIASIALSQYIMSNPSSVLSFWLSMIPFTSPVIMMVRIPFGVPVEQIIISLLILLGSIILVTWMAGKLYRTGILMYGKKNSYKELWKWLFYKN